MGNKRVVLVIEDAGQLLIGHYQTDVETLKELVLLLMKQLGKPLALITELKLPVLVLFPFFSSPCGIEAVKGKTEKCPQEGAARLTAKELIIGALDSKQS